MSETLQRIEHIARRHPQISVKLCERLELAARESGHIACQLDALYRRYFTLERLGKASIVMDALYQGLQLAEMHSLPRQAGRMLEAIGRIRYTRGEYREAIRFWTRCIDTSTLTGDLHSGIEGRIGLGQIFDALGDRQTGARFHRDAGELLKGIDAPYLASKVAINLGVNYCYLLGQLDLAAEQFQLGIAEAQRGEIDEYVAEAHWHLAHVESRRGDIEQAERLTRRALHLADACGYLWLKGAALDGLAQVLLQRERYDEAYELYQSALSFATEVGGRSRQAACYAALSQLAEKRGDLAAALEFARQQQHIETELAQLSTPERLRELMQYDLSQKPPGERLLDLASDAVVYQGSLMPALRHVADEAADILRIQYVTIWLRSGSDPTLVCHTQKAPPTDGFLIDFTISADSMPSYFALLDTLRDPLVVHDIHLHPAAKELLPLVQAAGLSSVLEVPLRMQGQNVGVISFAQTEKQRNWTREDVLHGSHIGNLVERVLANQEREQILAKLERSNEALEQRVQSRTQELESAKNAAEAATRAKSLFLATISHEIRTPLAGVIGMQDLALRDNLLREATREQIRLAQTNAQSLLNIINDLLDFSKIEAGKLALERIDFDLIATLRNDLRLFEEHAANKNLSFVLQLDAGLPNYVVGDPTRLRQVLVNLVGNAFKFTDKGEVRVEVELKQRIGAVNHIGFKVNDSGIGIAPDALSRLFEKFEQADASTTRRFGGTGLGLAICRQLVELMDGTIGVVSQLGQGSTFAFVLPMADGVAPQAAQAIIDAPHSHQLHILCAEDYPTNQIIIRTLLENLGHCVDLVETGDEAIRAAARHDYDVILMDVRMPEMDGVTATHVIRNGGLHDHPVRDRDIYIIALTANASDEDRQAYLQAGMNDFISKPIDERMLHHQLSRVIARRLEHGAPLKPLLRASSSELDTLFGVDSSNEAQAAIPDAADNLKQRLRDVFVNDLPTRLASLDEALAQRNSEAIGRLLHGLRGSIGYLEGTEELTVLCNRLEQAADDQAWERLNDGLPRLCERLRRDFSSAGR